jgi:hypothetical protein
MLRTMLRTMLAAAIALSAPRSAAPAIAQTLIDPTPPHIPESSIQRAAFNILVTNFPNEFRGSAIAIVPYTGFQEYAAAIFTVTGGQLNGQQGCLMMRVNDSTGDWEGITIRPECTYQNLVEYGVPPENAQWIMEFLR